MNMDQPDDTTEGNSIVEDVPLLISNQDPSQVKKTYTLNPTALVGNDAESGGRESVMQPKGKVQAQKAMTLAARGMSLATRADIDPVTLIERAKERTKMPIKLSWENLKYKAEVN